MKKKAKTLVFGNFKGGVGKTTISTMSAIELSRRGKRVLLIDFDPQANATNLLIKTRNNIINDGHKTIESESKRIKKNGRNRISFITRNTNKLLKDLTDQSKISKIEKKRQQQIEASNKKMEQQLLDSYNFLMAENKKKDVSEIFTFDTTLMGAIQDKNLSEAKINISDNLDLIASAADFSLFPNYMEMQKYDYVDRIKFMDDLIQVIKDEGYYDYIIIDVPPTISIITDTALYTADYCCVVLQTQERSLQGAQAFIEYIQNQVINTFKAPNLDVLGVIPVLFKNGAPVDLNTLAEAENIFDKENMFKTVIKVMERLKRYDISGVTFDNYYDREIQEQFSKVVDELLSRIKTNEE